MEHTKGSLGSQIQQQNQSKKKSKNKKKNSKNDNVVTRPIDDEQLQKQQQQYQSSSEGVVVVANGLSDQIKQQLHMGNKEDYSNDNNSTNLNNSNNSNGNNNSKSNSCSSNSNNNKVNGLMVENLKKSNKACPATTTIENDNTFQTVPALNGHHHNHHHHHFKEQEGDTSAGVSTSKSKKSKRKPNNKKNTNSLADTSIHLENGHCRDMTMMVTTNGFNHKEEEEEQQTDVTNTAIKAQTTNDTTNTTTTTTNRVNSSSQQQQPSVALEETLSKSQIPEPAKELDLTNVHIEYKEYESELQMHDIMRLIQAELSEPYSIYTYRYFIYNWPKLCFLAAHGNEYVGAIVCKLDMHMNVRRGYIAMLAVRKEYRKLKIGTTLVQKAIEAMLADKADEVVLETEMSNLPALRLYENLGFVRDKRLFRYYLNGVDALRLKLWFR